MSARTIIVTCIAVVVLAAVTGAGLWWGSRPRDNSQSEMRRAVAAVGQLMILPADETPTYGTVADKSKLSSQVFFKNAQDGDEVLIYEKARLSILYRPSIDKIVNVGPLIVGQDGSPYVTSRFVVLNGTGNSDLLDKMVQQITTAFPNAPIVYKGDASRTYPTTIAIDLTKKNQPLDEQVADSLHIQSGQMPLGESASDGDILIIIGQDYK